VLDADGRLIPSLNRREIADLRAEGVINGGMPLWALSSSTTRMRLLTVSSLYAWRPDRPGLRLAFGGLGRLGARQPHAEGGFATPPRLRRA
jgi:hypothetical protein